MHAAKSQLLRVELRALRPTQMTVGYEEVQTKKAAWQHMEHNERESFLADHWFPGVRGPKGNFYIIDHHHLGMALIEEGIQTGRLMLLNDFSALALNEFWVVMAHNQWAHPYDGRGKRCDLDAIPKKIMQLNDDPYRSLEGQARRMGASTKDRTPFSEFLWADFFRHRIALKLLRNQPELALQKALELAHSPVASHLPGWSGEHGG